MSSFITLSEHIRWTQKETKDGDILEALREISFIGKTLSKILTISGFINILGKTGKTNIQGEKVQELDRFANDFFKDQLIPTGYFCIMGSEEKEEEIKVLSHFQGNLALSIDPLDGSSNIDANVNIGSIFSFHRKISKEGSKEDLLQPGYRQVCAGYILYGPRTSLVYTMGNGVYGFTLDTNLGEFLLTYPKLTMPQECKIYSANEAYWERWDPETQNFITKLKKSGCTARYIGSLVADFHRNLLQGGIFLYPADTKNTQGKLRLLYEAAPLAFIAEQAGGKASTGKEDVLDVIPKDLHQRVPLIIGTKNETEQYASLFLKTES